MNDRHYPSQTIALLLIVLAVSGPSWAKDHERGRGNGHQEQKRDHGEQDRGNRHGARDRARGSEPGAQGRDRGDNRYRENDRGRHEPRKNGLPEGWHDRRRLNTPCHVIRNHTYVPVREPFEQLGGRVIWYADRHEAHIIYSDRALIVVPNSATVIVIQNGVRRPQIWDNPPLILGGNLYVPVRPVANGLGIQVSYASGNVALGADFYIPLG